MWLCRSCGRVYHGQTNVPTNTAPVVKTVNIRTAPWPNPCASTTNSKAEHSSSTKVDHVSEALKIRWDLDN